MVPVRSPAHCRPEEPSATRDLGMPGAVRNTRPGAGALGPPQPGCFSPGCLTSGPLRSGHYPWLHTPPRRRHNCIVTPTTRPTRLDLKKTERLEVDWQDGRTCVSPLSLLRSMCPCATCKTFREEQA